MAVSWPGNELEVSGAYSISAGVSLGHGEYVWIGQKDIVTEPQDPIFENVFDFQPGEDPPLATHPINKGRGKLFVVRAVITQPVSDLTFIAAHPMGYDVNKINNQYFTVAHFPKNI